MYTTCWERHPVQVLPVTIEQHRTELAHEELCWKEARMLAHAVAREVVIALEWSDSLGHACSAIGVSETYLLVDEEEGPPV